MTPNLASARKAIQAELLHAKDGMAFYSARVEALETALTQLESVEGDATETAERGSASGKAQQAGESRRGRKPRTARSAAGTASARPQKQGRKARGERAPKEEGQLPTTGASFWLDLVTAEPRTAVEIANAAVSMLGIESGQKDKIQKLKQRVAPALTALVSSQKIKDSGAGRARRFFRDAGQAA